MDDDEAAESPEVISLTVPHESRYVNVVRIVVGGLAARLDLPFESLDDLQLAVETVLSEERYVAGGEITVDIVIDNGLVRVLIAPLETDALEADLESADDGIGLGMLLSAVVDSVGFDMGPGGERSLSLEKRIPRAIGS